MNKEELKEFLKEHGDVKMAFDGYFKYCFCFESVSSDVKKQVSFGGDSGEIYDAEVLKEYTLHELVSEFCWMRMSIYVGQDRIYEFKEYEYL